MPRYFHIAGGRKSSAFGGDRQGHRRQRKPGHFLQSRAQLALFGGGRDVKRVEQLGNVAAASRQHGGRVGRWLRQGFGDHERRRQRGRRERRYRAGVPGHGLVQR